MAIAALQQIIGASTHEKVRSGSSDQGIVTGTAQERRGTVSREDGVIPHPTDQNRVSSPTRYGLVIRPAIRSVEVIEIERHAVGKLGDGEGREEIDEVGQQNPIAGCSNRDLVDGEPITGIEQDKIARRNPGPKLKTIHIGRALVGNFVSNLIETISGIEHIGVASPSTVQDIIAGAPDERVIPVAGPQGLTTAQPQHAIVGEGSEHLPVASSGPLHQDFALEQLGKRQLSSIRKMKCIDCVWPSGIFRGNSEKMQSIPRRTNSNRQAPPAECPVIRHTQHLLRDAGTELHRIGVSCSRLVIDQIESVTLIEHIGVITGSAEQHIVSGTAFNYIITSPSLDDLGLRGTRHHFTIVNTQRRIHECQQARLIATRDVLNPTTESNDLSHQRPGHPTQVEVR